MRRVNPRHSVPTPHAHLFYFFVLFFQVLEQQLAARELRIRRLKDKLQASLSSDRHAAVSSFDITGSQPSKDRAKPDELSVAAGAEESKQVSSSFGSRRSGVGPFCVDVTRVTGALEEDYCKALRCNEYYGREWL